MGRMGSRLVPFLKEGLAYEKYKNLRFKGSSRTVFSIFFPHKTRRLHKSDQFIFQDWYARNGKLYCFGLNYTEARQAMTASLKKSDYLSKMKSKDDVLTFRMLSDEEVKEKKKRKKEAKKRIERKKDDEKVTEESDGDYAPSSVDSGYGGSISSPDGHVHNVLSDEELVQAIEHDHAFGFTFQAKPQLEENTVECNLNAAGTSFEEIDKELMHACCSSNENVSFIEQPTFNHEYDVEINKLSTVSFEFIDFNASDERMNEYNSEQPENVQLEDLYRIPLKEFLILGPEEISVPSKEFNLDLTELPHGLPVMNRNDESKTENGAYHAEKFQYCGNVLILFCEPVELGAGRTDHSGELKIFFHDVVLNELQNKRVKEYKFIGDHMLVFLYPNDDY